MDVLLIGGPSDGEVVQIDPALEDGYSVVDAKTEERHDYIFRPLLGVEQVWGLGIHESMFEYDRLGPSLDAVIARLVDLYVAKSDAKTEIPAELTG